MHRLERWMDGVLAQFACPRVRGFALSLCPRGGAFTLSKQFPRGWPGAVGEGWSRLSLTDTICVAKHKKANGEGNCISRFQ